MSKQTCDNCGSTLETKTINTDGTLLLTCPVCEEMYLFPPPVDKLDRLAQRYARWAIGRLFEEDETTATLDRDQVFKTVVDAVWMALDEGMGLTCTKLDWKRPI